jgi:hypothetical protein
VFADVTVSGIISVQLKNEVSDIKLKEHFFKLIKDDLEYDFTVQNIEVKKIIPENLEANL